MSLFLIRIGDHQSEIPAISQKITTALVLVAIHRKRMSSYRYIYYATETRPQIVIH